MGKAKVIIFYVKLQKWENKLCNIIKENKSNAEGSNAANE